MRLIVPGLCTLLVLHPGNAGAKSWLFVSLLKEKQIVAFERDLDTGALTRRGETQCAGEPAFMRAIADRELLFVCLRSTGQLASFQIDPDNGTLKMISVVPGGDDPAYLLPDKRGRYLVSAYYQSNKVVTHRLHVDGAIHKTPMQTVWTAEKAHGIAFTSSNQFAFVPHTGANRIYQFTFDAQTGRLSAGAPPFVSTPVEHHPRHIALHPSDRWAYVNNEAGDSLSVFSIDPISGTLRDMQTVSSLPVGYDGARNATARCEISPNGKFVYVANRGHDSIACYAIDQRTGRVHSLGQVGTEKTPRSFSIDPSGRFLYAAGQQSGRVAAYRIATDGGLDRIDTYSVGKVPWYTVAVDIPEIDTGATEKTQPIRCISMPVREN